MNATPTDLERALARAIADSAADGSRLARGWKDQDCLFLAVDVPGEPQLVLQIRAARPDTRAYRVVDELAFGYRGAEARDVRRLDRLVVALAATLSAAGFDPSRDALPAAPADAIPPFPTPWHRAYLETEVPLATDVIDAFRRDGHVLVRRALLPDVILSARPYLQAALERAWPADQLPVEERPDAYSQAFTQINDLGLGDATVGAFSHSRRIARMAADLMGVEGVRIFCEDWLIKEPGAPITPWHQDEIVFPFDARETITCWIPLHTVGPGTGLLRFARGSHRTGLAPVERIDDESEETYSRIIAEHGLSVDELPPVFLGNVSFHHGRTIHGAFPNTGGKPRTVLALHCFADGAKLKVPTTRTMAALLAGDAPGKKPGEPAESATWPLVYGGAPPEPRRGAQAHHLRATLLPGGQVRDVWITNGRLWLRPVEEASELAPAGGYLTSGLVECHGHISYPHNREMQVDTPEWMNARRADYAATGVLALRDMGAVGNEITSLVDLPGLPRVHASGNMVLRNDEFPFTRTEPRDLVRTCVSRIEHGARWVKVFADFTDDFRGRVNSGFTENDAVTYPPDLLAEAVRETHAAGGRLAAHCFTRAGAEAAIEAGVDSLEHGWGADESAIEQMAAKGIAWVPLVGIATIMWGIARDEGEMDRVEWIERTMERLARLLPFAESRGVQIFAGTDWFPSVTVTDEIRQLSEFGVRRETAMAAGTSAARAWLGEPGIEDGAPADLVLFREDPRTDLAVLERPELILLGGERVASSFGHVRPRYYSWAERARGRVGP